MARGSKLSAHARYALLAGYAVATFLSFPQPLGDRVVDLGLGLGWLGPALLVAGLRGLSPRRAAGVGFAAGSAAQAAVLHWLYIVSVDHGQALPLVGLLGPLGMGAHTGAFFAIFAASLCGLERRGRAAPWLVAALWTTTEYLRSLGQVGFPWSTLGYTQHANAPLLGITQYTGVYGLSFATAWAGAALASAVVDARAGRRPRAALGALVGVALLHAAGAWIVATAHDSNHGTDTVRVAVLQGNIAQSLKWDPEHAARTVRIYEDLARRAVADGAELIVYPESALPAALNSDATLRFRAAQLARETGAAFVLGSVAVERGIPGSVPKVFDSAFIVQPSGEFTERYDKSHLVPFGEYVPLRDWLGWLFKAVAQGIALEGVTPGAAPRAVSIQVGSLAGTLTAGVPICYELLFPDLTRRFVDDGAELLLAITNDAWYGRTGAPHQFLAMTAVRSAETGVWTARAANTGVSAIIDARGRVRAQTRIFERDLLVADVPLRPSPVGGTFYSRNGDWFARGCAVTASAALIVGSTRRRPVAHEPHAQGLGPVQPLTGDPNE